MSMSHKLWTIFLVLSTVATVFLSRLVPKCVGSLAIADERIASASVVIAYISLAAVWLIWFFSSEADYLGKRLSLTPLIPLLLVIARLIFMIMRCR